MSKIEQMNYSEFVGFIGERNRPSGGIKTVQEVIVNSRINKDNKVLEIGSNTGFTSVNIGLLTGASVVGIDINKESVAKAKKYATKMNATTVEFIEGSALKLPFPEASFDLVWCSNVTSFVDDKMQAIAEYLRVLKLGGMLVVVPIYYRNTPPAELVDEVSSAIGCKIEVWNKDFWTNLFRKVGDLNNAKLEIIYEKDYKYLNQSERINGYIDNILSKNLGEEIRNSTEFEDIRARAKYFYNLFNENNFKYAGYSTILMQKRRDLDEEELFLSETI